MVQPGQSGAQEEHGGTLSLVFLAGSVLCAVHLDEVVETMRPLDVRPLPATPSYVRGVAVIRGVPTPVVDVARLVGSESAQVTRFVAVRTEYGPLAFATGEVLGIQEIVAAVAAGHPALYGGADSRLIAGVGKVGTEPVLLLQSMRVVPDDVWAAAAGVSP